MSKFILRKRTSGFTTVSNNVIHVLKGNLVVLGLYLYLLSLPDNWEFHKTYLCKECHLGINKLDKLLKILGSFGLIQYGQKRDANGRFEHFYMDIFDLESIKINDLKNQVQPVYENRGTVTVAPSQEAIKEIKQNKKEKENISCSSVDEPNTHFEQFWKLYPRKQKKKRANQIWAKKKLDNIGDKIIQSLRYRLNNDWKTKDREFIPLPDSYLNQERWTDEIDNSITPLVKPMVHYKNENKLNEIKSSVPWLIPDPFYN